MMSEQREVEGIIFDIDHFAVHDGEGIRTCVYLKGCPLHCRWCHSPESQEEEPEILFAPGRCTGCGACVAQCPRGLQRIEEGVRIFDRAQCIKCGACVLVCAAGALTLSGKRRGISEVLEELVEDREFYRNSNGGVTISGGEVLSQPVFVTELLKGLKREGIHNIIETSGYGRKEDLMAMAEYTDLFFYDYKLGDKEEFETYIGGDAGLVYSNLEALRRITDRIVLRVPMIPGITDTDRNIKMLYDIAGKLRIGRIHFLPYNPSAGAKYQWCGREYTLEGLQGDMERLEQLKAMAPETVEVEIVE